jgi:hypothetical protein
VGINFALLLSFVFIGVPLPFEHYFCSLTAGSYSLAFEAQQTYSSEIKLVTSPSARSLIIRAAANRVLLSILAGASCA